MEKTYVFMYVSTAKAEESKQNSESFSLETAAIDAKWRVIDYILKRIILKTG